MIVSLARAVARSPFLELRRVSLDELLLGRRRPGLLANLLLVRWFLDDGARACSGWEHLLADLDSPRKLGERTLTPIRLGYLQAFSVGLTRAQVGKLHGVGEETVKEELLHIREALGGARNVTHAVAIAIRRGLI